ncbi:unnamed protein product [Pleuronectes platessa]|uniref:Uncharacterized protein n=1 Tax=Pleuronectes platessa TaxID=8262 RepID=A0A9N7V6T5_PLEPL|nr:unnamed protein product [Pleuronectes platessa]
MSTPLHRQDQKSVQLQSASTPDNTVRCANRQSKFEDPSHGFISLWPHLIPVPPHRCEKSRKLNTAGSLSDPVPDFFSTPAASSSHTDEGRSAKHLRCSALHLLWD